MAQLPYLMASSWLHIRLDELETSEPEHWVSTAVSGCIGSAGDATHLGVLSGHERGGVPWLYISFQESKVGPVCVVCILPMRILAFWSFHGSRLSPRRG